MLNAQEILPIPSRPSPLTSLAAEAALIFYLPLHSFAYCYFSRALSLLSKYGNVHLRRMHLSCCFDAAMISLDVCVQVRQLRFD